MRVKGRVGLMSASMVVVSFLLVASFPATPVGTYTFHGSDESRTGYFAVNDDDIENNEINRLILQEDYMIASPVTAIVKIDDTWRQGDSLEDNKQYAAVCSENVVTVYRITYNDDYESEREFIWTFEFQSPVVGTPLTFTLEEPGASSQSLEGLFIVTRGYHNGMKRQGDLTLPNIQSPEIFLFNIQTGELLLYNILQVDEFVYSSPALLRWNADQAGDDEFYFYFTSIGTGQYLNRISIVKIIGNWEWSRDGINSLGVGQSPIKSFQITDAVDYISYTSPAFTDEMFYAYNTQLEHDDNNPKQKTIEPYIIQPGTDGKVYALHWDDFNIPDEELDDECPERIETYIEESEEIVGKYIHSSPTTFVTTSNRMIEDGDSDTGWLSYIDIGVDDCIEVSNSMRGVFARFFLYLEISINGNDEYELELKFELVNYDDLQYKYVTSSSALICEYDSTVGLYRDGLDKRLYREFVESWEFDESSNQIKMWFYVFEVEEEYLSGDAGLYGGSEIEMVFTINSFTSYAFPHEPVIIPSPVCSDDNILVVFGNHLYRIRIDGFIDINNYYYYSTMPEWYTFYATPIMTYDSICLASPAISYVLFYHDHDNVFEYTFQVLELTLENSFYLTSGGNHGIVRVWHRFKDYDDHQWHRYQRGSMWIATYDKMTSMPGHINCRLPAPYISRTVANSVMNNWDTVFLDLSQGPINAWSPAISSPLTYTDGFDTFVISVQKNVLTILDQDLTIIYKRFLETPVFSTPTIVWNYNLGGSVIDLLVVITGGRHADLTPFKNSYAQRCAKIYVISLEDHLEYDVYDMVGAVPEFNPVSEVWMVHSSPLSKQINANQDYIFFTATRLDVGVVVIQYTYSLFRFQLIPQQGQVGWDIVITKQEDASYGSGACDKVAFDGSSIFSFSSPTWCRWIEGANDFLDTWAMICFGMMNQNGINFKFYRWDNFNFATGLALGGGNPDIHFSTPAVLYKYISPQQWGGPGLSRTYITIGADSNPGTAAPARIHWIELQSLPQQSLPPNWPASFVTNVQSQNLDKEYTTSPAMSQGNDYIFISTTDFATPPNLQSTNMYMIHNPYNGGVLNTLDTIPNIQSNSNFFKPAPIVSTNKDAYLPIGETIKFSGIGINQFTNKPPNDLMSFTSVSGTVFWSASLAISSDGIDTYSYCSNTGGQIRRWEPL